MKKAMDARAESKKKLIPKKGFNLVGVDDYETPEDELYLIGNFPSRERAEKAMKERQKKNHDELMFVYGPDDA